MEEAKESGVKVKFLKVLGYILLILSFVFWASAILIPFVFEKNVSLALTPTFIIIGEVSFYLSILLLGKQIWNRIKNFFKVRKSRTL